MPCRLQRAMSEGSIVYASPGGAYLRTDTPGEGWAACESTMARRGLGRGGGLTPQRTPAP